MKIRAKWVVDRQMDLHSNRSIQVRGKKAETLDLGNALLMPGLFNAHCHLDYTEMRGGIHPQRRFVDWIAEINRIKRSWSWAHFSNSISRGLEESLAYGVTSMVNWICIPETLDSVEPLPLRIWWLWEQIAFKPGSRLEDWEDWPSKVMERSPLWKAGLAPHAPYTCRATAIQKAEAWSSQHQLPWSIHLSESREEFEMFRHKTGPMFDLFSRFGREMDDCGHSTPLALLNPFLVKARSPVLLAHLNHLETSDFDLLKSLMEPQRSKLTNLKSTLKTPRAALFAPHSAHRAPQFSVVHCPRSHEYFRHAPFPLEKLRSLGIPVCLGTDSLASNQDLSMFMEMRQASREFPDLSPKEIVRMATLEGARALGLEKFWLEWQDWVAIPSRAESPQEAWHEIINFTGKPFFVMVNGKILKQLSIRT